jgi:hypothetical protein
MAYRERTTTVAGTPNTPSKKRYRVRTTSPRRHFDIFVSFATLAEAHSYCWGIAERGLQWVDENGDTTFVPAVRIESVELKEWQ